MVYVDPVSAADSFSRCAVHLTMFWGSQAIATGSGVIAEHSSSRYLITAWHNLAGKNPETGAVMSPTGGIPNRVDIEGCHTRLSANLYDGDNDPLTSRPLFAAHPAGSKIDVTLLRLRDGTKIYQALDVSFLTPSLNTQLPLRISQTCYILGFAEGIIHRVGPDVVFLIWKTGHIASEPAVDFNDEPKLLIDATTRRGMSGAMVVVKEPPRHRFVGIYAGRYKQATPTRSSREGDPDIENDRNFTSELGWVFKSSAIDELMTAFQRSKQ